MNGQRKLGPRFEADKQARMDRFSFNSAGSSTYDRPEAHLGRQCCDQQHRIMSRHHCNHTLWLAFLIVAAALVAARANAQQSPLVDAEPTVRITQGGLGLQHTAPDDTSALAEKFQNQIADLISVPFQNNTNFNVGPQTGNRIFSISSQ